MELLTQELRAQLLENGARRRQTEDGSAEPDFLPVVKFFTPDAGCTWLLTELDPDDPDIAFGLCDLHSRPATGVSVLREALPAGPDRYEDRFSDSSEATGEAMPSCARFVATATSGSALSDAAYFATSSVFPPPMPTNAS